MFAEPVQEQGINHNDLRAKLGIPPLAAAMEQEQMRWLGHIARMQSDQPRTYSKMFARGTLDAGEFQRVAAAAGGRISADRRSLPEVWINLCHQHGFCESEIENKAADRNAVWTPLLNHRLRQAIYEDQLQSHSHKNVSPDPGLRPWSRPQGRRQPSPEAKARKVELQRIRRAQPKPAVAPPRQRAAPAADPNLPRPVRRNAEKRTYYAGQNQRKVTAEERDQWPWICDHHGCQLRFETERALKIHRSKANKPGGTHSQLPVP